MHVLLLTQISPMSHKSKCDAIQMRVNMHSCIRSTFCQDDNCWYWKREMLTRGFYLMETTCRYHCITSMSGYLSRPAKKSPPHKILTMESEPLRNNTFLEQPNSYVAALCCSTKTIQYMCLPGRCFLFACSSSYLIVSSFVCSCILSLGCFNTNYVISQRL